MNQDISKEKVNKKKRNRLFVLLFCILTILGSFSVYLISTRKTLVNPMDYANVSIIGYGENRELSVQARANNEKDSGEKKKGNLPELLAILRFSANKTKDIKNGDVIEIQLLTRDDELEKVGYKASTRKLSYTVSGLVELPERWEDISQKDQIMEMISKQIEHKKQMIIEYYDKKSGGINGVSNSIELIPRELNIYLENKGKICSPQVARIDNCAKVSVIQRFDIENNSSMSFGSKSLYIISGISNLYINEDGALSTVMYVENPESINSDSVQIFQDLESLESILFESGFVKQ